MEAFENSPEALVIKDALREFFLGIIHSIRGAFLGFLEWIKNVPLTVPPLIKVFGNGKANLILFGVILLYIVFINIKTYRLFKKDKLYAKNEEERIPEFRLFLNMWLGGAPGGLIALYKFRHKTMHKSFTVTGKVLAFLDVLIYSFLLGFMGFWAFL